MTIKSKPILLVALLLVGLSVIGCSTMHLPDYVPRSVDSYQNAKTDGLLTVATEPMNDQATVRQYFGTDLLAKGILARACKSCGKSR